MVFKKNKLMMMMMMMMMRLTSDVKRASSLNAPYPRGGGIIRSFHSIHNVVDGGVLQAMNLCEELAGKVGQRDQLIIC